MDIRLNREYSPELETALIGIIEDYLTKKIDKIQFLVNLVLVDKNKEMDSYDKTYVTDRAFHPEYFTYLKEDDNSENENQNEDSDEKHYREFL